MNLVAVAVTSTSSLRAPLKRDVVSTQSEEEEQEDEKDDFDADADAAADDE